MATRQLLTALFFSALLISGGVIAAGDIERLKQAAVQDPASEMAWDRLGQALAREGRYIDAQLAFDRALRLAPRSAAIRHHAAIAYAWSGNYAEAISRYRLLVKDYPNVFGIRIDYGQALAWNGQFDDAQKQYRYVLNRDPRNQEALRHIGLLSAWQGDYDEALKLFDKALQDAPANRQLLFNKAEVLSWKGAYDDAVALLHKILESQPNDLEAINQLGQVYLWHGQYRASIDAYRKSLELDAEKIDAYLGLVDAYIRNHQFSAANKILLHARQRFASDPRLAKRLSAIAGQQDVSAEDMIEFVEPIIFIIILLTVFRYVSRYRRILAHQNRTAGLLFSILPYLALLTATIYVLVYAGSAYYHELRAVHDFLEILNLTTLLAVFLSLIWLLRFDRPARKQTVLAIGAHPDDLEFGCGATLLRYREEGCDTYGLVLTGGEKGVTEGAEDSIRQQEARSASRVMALKELTMLDFPDTQLSQHTSEIKNAIEVEINRINPDIIFTHTIHDLHSDHKAVFEATREAARGAQSILCYENPNTPPEFNPDYFIDISDYLDDKVIALARHKSQAGKTYIDKDVVRGSAAFRGSQGRIKHAEAFEIVRLLEKPIL